MPPLFADASRTVIVAIDHPLYMWPVAGLEDRHALIAAVADAGADAFIASYGTLRDCADVLAERTKIMKLDLATVSVGTYRDSEFRPAWTLEDAVRVGADAVLTYVQLGTDGELDALVAAARVATEADRAGLAYVCEIMPVQSAPYPDPYDPAAIAAAARTAAELGAHVVKTSMPTPPEAVALATTCGLPVVIAGGDPTPDTDALVGRVGTAIAAGAAGVAFGRNVWGSPDPAGMVRRLRSVVHGAATAT
jgi:fructose-bisphosphate aldolase / 2-amino-3,7-dideoxy-D-threo-hept-6-ulosonate synthase